MPMIYEFHPDWPTNFILTSNDVYILVVSLLRHTSSTSLGIWRGPRAGCSETYKEDYFKINAYPDSSDGSVRRVPSTAINESHWWEPQWVVRPTKKTTSRSTPIQILVMVAWEEYPQLLLIKAIGGSHSLSGSSGGSVRGVPLTAINESHWWEPQ